MKGMAGGSYTKALRTTFLPEFLSMNWLMAAMVPVATMFRTRFPEAQHPGNAPFWFAMSVALLAGFVVAYPINWWLVSHHLKHRMLTVRPDASEERHGSPKHGLGGAERKATTSVGWLVAMTSVSLVVLALGLFVASQIAAHG